MTPDLLARLKTQKIELLAMLRSKAERGPFCPYADHVIGWYSTYGRDFCVACHPPATPSLVKEWLLVPDKAAIEALMAVAHCD